jgi:hypothetical protein
MRILILAVLALVSWTARATITIELDADLLKGPTSTPMPMSGLVLLVASTNDTTFNAPTPTAFVSGDDIILAKFDLSGGTNGVCLGFAPGIKSTLVGKPIMMYWYPTLNLNSTVPGNGTPFGSYRTDSPLDGSDAWVTPADGASINLRFLTSDANLDYHNPAGSNPASLAIANQFVGGAPSPTLLISLLQGGALNIHLTGTPNAGYTVQYVTALLLSNSNNWQTLGSGTTDNNGMLDLPDNVSNGTSRFYRGSVGP